MVPSAVALAAPSEAGGGAAAARAAVARVGVSARAGNAGSDGTCIRGGSSCSAVVRAIGLWLSLFFAAKSDLSVWVSIDAEEEGIGGGAAGGRTFGVCSSAARSPDAG